MGTTDGLGWLARFRHRSSDANGFASANGGTTASFATTRIAYPGRGAGVVTREQLLRAGRGVGARGAQRGRAGAGRRRAEVPAVRLAALSLSSGTCSEKGPAAVNELDRLRAGATGLFERDWTAYFRLGHFLEAGMLPQASRSSNPTCATPALGQGAVAVAEGLAVKTGDRRSQAALRAGARGRRGEGGRGDHQAAAGSISPLSIGPPFGSCRHVVGPSCGRATVEIDLVTMNRREARPGLRSHARRHLGAHPRRHEDGSPSRGRGWRAGVQLHDTSPEAAWKSPRASRCRAHAEGGDWSDVKGRLQRGPSRWRLAAPQRP